MLNILDLNANAKSYADKVKTTALPAPWGSAELATAKAILACHGCNAACFVCAFPQMTGCTSALCVRDDSGYARCGKSCTWTVPAGATLAKFELWGPGSPSGGGMCCGGAHWGASGAYATIIIPVTPGCQYTMCGGCSICLSNYCTYNCAGQGSPSYVTGFGLSNFCAEGGCHNYLRRMCLQRTQLCGMSMCCRVQNPSCTSSGACYCGVSYYCYSNSCDTCGIIPVFSDTEVTFYGTPFGHNSFHPHICFDGNHYGYEIHPPLVDASNGACAAGCCCFTYSSGTCCGMAFNACNGYSCQPGLGGYPSHAMGGNTELYGGWGRMGMAKVSWK